MSEDEITDRFGMPGVREFRPAYGRSGGAITDDTQMTLFTAEGLIRGKLRWRTRGIAARDIIIYRAYLRWLETQGYEVKTSDEWALKPSWLSGVRELHSSRSPGNACLSALASGQMGHRNEPINDSKGCGGIMRAAPAGLTGASSFWAFDAGCELAAITHGHPSGWIAAGAFAAIVAGLRSGKGLSDAVDEALRLVDIQGPSGGEVKTALDSARVLSESKTSEGLPKALREGWVAEETLAIAVYCCLVTTSFEDAVSMAVSHGGDSDSTGSVAGNLAGLLYGQASIPERWLSCLELKDVIERLAEDFESVFLLDADLDRLIKVYPPV